MKRIVLIWGVLVLSVPAYGVVYTWKDAGGVAHYANRDYQIPERYRSRAKALYPEQTDAPASGSSPALLQVAPVVPQAAPVIPPDVKPAEVTQVTPAAPPVSPPAATLTPKSATPARATKYGKRSRGGTSEEE